MGRSLDLSELDGVDLTSLRLGAQVMAHKAELAGRPRVDAFFRSLMLTVDEETARRRRTPDDRPIVDAADLPLPGSTGAQLSTAEDRRLSLELLNLLAGNPRLAQAVRHVVRQLRDGVDGPA